MIDPSVKNAGQESASNPIFGILLLIAVALLAAELVRHKKRLPSFFGILIYTYTEFVLLGLAIGPRGLNLIDERLLIAADPFLHLSLGGIGLIFGLQFSFTQMKRFQPHMFYLTFFQAAITFAVCALSIYLLMRMLGAVHGDALFLAAVLATIASVSAPQIIAHTIREQKVRGENAHLLQFITALDGSFGVFVLTLIVGARTEFGLTPWKSLNAVTGLALCAAVGVACGVVFHWLTELRTTAEEMVLYLMGLVILSSSVAATLHLSPLFVNIVFGLTVANLSVRVEEVFGQLGRLERPLFIVLLILAGARWEIALQWVLPLILVYLTSRFLGKWAGCRLGIRWFPLYFKPVDRLGFGLIGQGGIALALLINFSLIEHNRSESLAEAKLADVIDTVVIAAIMITELAAPILVRHVLARGGEWRTDT